ncbi:hypothetical protein TYRP_022472 [Tyrophagus putrescentiae]|nr:hypothetical protein TYRP_022472 [Tyrophagus putrescentiae]
MRLVRWRRAQRRTLPPPRTVRSRTRFTTSGSMLRTRRPVERAAAKRLPSVFTDTLFTTGGWHFLLEFKIVSICGKRIQFEAIFKTS